MTGLLFKYIYCIFTRNIFKILMIVSKKINKHIFKALRGRQFAFVLELVTRNYVAAERIFQSGIEENNLFAEDLQIERQELFDEFESISLLFRTNSEIDPVTFHMEAWTLEAAEFFNQKIHAFIQKILCYQESITELMGHQFRESTNNNL